MKYDAPRSCCFAHIGGGFRRKAPGAVASYGQHGFSTHGRRALLAVGGAILLALAAGRTVAQACAGDCDGDRQVTIDELILAVDIALGSSALDRCGSADRERDGTVTVDDLVAMVRGALAGCAPDGTPTTAVTGTPSSAPTATPSTTASSQFEITIRGAVYEASSSGTEVSPLPGAKVGGTVDRNGDGAIQEPEAVRTVAGDNGGFELRVSAARGETVVVAFEAEGFAPLFRTIGAEDIAELVLNVTLKPTEPLACNGPRCAIKGEALSIEGLPDNLSGAARVFNPVTETDAFPGDFSDSAGNLLVSGVFAAVNLTDASGNPVKDLAAEVTLRMRIPRDTWGVIRDIAPNNGQIDVPMYAFDEALGTWVREGDGVLEDGNGALLTEDALPQIRNGTLIGVVVARSRVGHFSYWNVDWPVDSHACVSGVVADAGGIPARGATVLVRGATYTGSSKPVTVGADGRFCVEVMRSEGAGEDVDQDGVLGETQKIRIRVTHQGKLYDLGEYAVPAVQGTCGVGGCADVGTLRLTTERELQPALCSLSGTVRAGDGNPVAGAMVVAVDETVPEDVQTNLCAQTELGYCDLVGMTDAGGFFRLNTVVIDSLYYASFSNIADGDSTLLLSTQGTVQGCPSAPLNIVLSDGLRTVTVTVGISGNAITWSPSRFNAGMLYVSSGQQTNWAIFGEDGGFSSPVTYGVVPPGAVQGTPVDGAPPVPLASGNLVNVFLTGVGADSYPYWGFGSGVVP